MPLTGASLTFPARGIPAPLRGHMLFSLPVSQWLAGQTAQSEWLTGRVACGTCGGLQGILVALRAIFCTALNPMISG